MADTILVALRSDTIALRHPRLVVSDGDSILEGWAIPVRGVWTSPGGVRDSVWTRVPLYEEHKEFDGPRTMSILFAAGMILHLFNGGEASGG